MRMINTRIPNTTWAEGTRMKTKAIITLEKKLKLLADVFTEAEDPRAAKLHAGQKLNSDDMAAISRCFTNSTKVNKELERVAWVDSSEEE